MTPDTDAGRQKLQTQAHSSQRDTGIMELGAEEWMDGCKQRLYRAVAENNGRLSQQACTALQPLVCTSGTGLVTVIYMYEKLLTV